jgi:integrase
MEVVALPRAAGHSGEVAPCRLQAVCLNAGLRIGEIRSLRWCDVDDKRKRITVRSSYDTRNNLKSTKNGKIRKVPLSDRLADALKELNPLDAASWAGKATIIQHLKLEKPLSYWAMRDKILAIYKAAGVEVPELPWHCLRHAFCTELAESGVPIHTIKELAGHSSIETTLRYMHTGEKAKQEAIAKAFESKCHKNATSHSPKREKPRN